VRVRCTTEILISKQCQLQMHHTQILIVQVEAFFGATVERTIEACLRAYSLPEVQAVTRCVKFALRASA